MTVFIVLSVCVTIVAVSMICASVVMRIKERERECPLYSKQRGITKRGEMFLTRLERVSEKLEEMSKEGEE